MAEQATKEPTMEEILASIRRIISEDGEPVEEVAATQAEASISEISSETQGLDEFETDDADDGHLLSVDDLLGNEVDFSEIEEFGDLEEEVNLTAEPVDEASVTPETELDAMLSEADEIDAILDLEDEVADDIIAPEPAEEAPEPVMEVAASELEPVYEAPEPVMETPMPATAATRETLTDDLTATAAAGALGKLISTLDVKSESTIEGLVREMLKPMIKEWLDDNLAAIVERKVEAEVQRISKMVG